MEFYQGLKIKDVKGSHGGKPPPQKSVWKRCPNKPGIANRGEAWRKYKPSVNQHESCYGKQREKKLSAKNNQKVLGKVRRKLEQRYGQNKIVDNREYGREVLKLHELMGLISQ